MFDLILVGISFRSKGIRIVFYGFVNKLSLFLTVDMNKGFVKCNKVVLSEAVNKCINLFFIEVSEFADFFEVLEFTDFFGLSDFSEEVSVTACAGREESSSEAEAAKGSSSSVSGTSSSFCRCRPNLQ